MAINEAPPKTSHLAPYARGRRKWRLMVYSLIGLLVLITAGTLGIGWYFSSQALDLSPERLDYSIRVFGFQGKSVRLARTDDTMRPGVYGLWSPSGGHVTLGGILSSTKTIVVRQFTGNPRGIGVGGLARFDVHVYQTTSALHLKYYRVRVPDRLGEMPAWYVPGSRSIWVILVHGLGAGLSSGLPPMATLAQLGLPMLDISYRNDVGAPASSDHLYHLGATEWQDVEASARYATAHGARKVVLYGYSMGGSLVESFLHRSRMAGRVRAVVLDAPALDWNAVYDFHASRMNVPGVITAVAKRIIAWRIGLGNLDEVNEVKPHVDFKVRTLMFQGLGDTTVPSGSNASLAKADPNHVTYVPVPGAEHIQEWNANPAAYDRELKRFLVKVLR